MRIDSLLIADTGSAADGLLSVGGAGWEFFKTPIFPRAITGVAAGFLTLADDELDKEFIIRIMATPSIEHALSAFDAATVLVLERLPTEGITARAPFAVPFALVASAPAIVTFTASCPAAENEATYSFAVQSEIPDSLA